MCVCVYVRAFANMHVYINTFRRNRSTELTKPICLIGDSMFRFIINNKMAAIATTLRNITIIITIITITIATTLRNITTIITIITITIATTLRNIATIITIITTTIATT